MIYEWSYKSPHFPNRTARGFDAVTGEEIRKIRYIDTETNELRRFAVDENGNIMRPVKIITETRAVRIEWQ